MQTVFFQHTKRDVFTSIAQGLRLKSILPLGDSSDRDQVT